MHTFPTSSFVSVLVVLIDILNPISITSFKIDMPLQVVLGCS